MANKEEITDLDADIRIIADLKNQVTRGFTNFKKSPKDRITEPYLVTRLEGLEELIDRFRLKHEAILRKYDEGTLEEHGYLEADVYANSYEEYLDYKTSLKSALTKFKKPKDKGSDNSNSNVNIVRLPKITLPTFSGKYSEWTSFRDLFTSLVHNNSQLDDVQKLHYLKTQLSGEAEQLVRSIPITQANYNKCWELLKNRYNNKRHMSNNILKRLFGQRTLTVESSSALKEILDTTNDCLHELSNLGINTKDWDIMVIYVISLKLDVETRKQWELHVSESSDDFPSLEQFQKFLCTRFRALEMVEPSKIKPKSVSSNVSTKSLHTTTQPKLCKNCSENHKLHQCKRFTQEDVNKRRELAASLNVCFNCLGNNHNSATCRSSMKCLVCHRKHHTLLHPQGPEIVSSESSAGKVRLETKQPESPSTAKETIPAINSLFLTGNVYSQTLLATALVKAESRNGQSQILRVLIDQGSQASFISEAAVQLLNLNRICAKSTISGLGGSKGLTSKYVTSCGIQSLHAPEFKLRIQAHVVSNVTSILPERKFAITDWDELKGLPLADPHFNKPNKIHALLGAEIYCKIIKPGLMKNPTDTAIAQDTYLGWILSGTVGGKHFQTSQQSVVLNTTVQVEDVDILKRFWELEAEPTLSKTKLLTCEEQACEDHFNATTDRDGTGRYIVELPFRCPDPPCKYGNSRDIAVKRLLSLEKRLSKDEQSKEQYHQVLKEYLSLGHMEAISEEKSEQADKVWLPHHAVVRMDKTTTKTRVVFNASSKGTNGVSLNDSLMVGPTIQPDLRHIMLRWRLYPICLTADIIKMYRQVRVADKHTDFQRIVWRDDVASEIMDYRLLTVTFGTASAPYLAVKALQQTAVDEGQNYPLAAERVKRDFYMDDLMTGCYSETEAIKIYQEMNEMLQKGGFTLQKWSSNILGLLDSLQGDLEKKLEIKVDEVTKVLGLTWNRRTDGFHYTVKLAADPSETKRGIISEISRLYDPLGWIAPCIITAKIFIQKLWIAGLGWDEVVPPELLQEWNKYRSELTDLATVRIPRWLSSHENDGLELHGFSDASNVAYAAVVYVRVIGIDGKITSHLVTAKTKVAPIKQVSVPRLELCGAVLVTKLLMEVAEVLKVDIKNIRAWTDSTVVLAWLCAHPSRWKTFIANRTSEILTHLDSQQWSYVKSKDNPADAASRGVSPSTLTSDQLWMQGPEWLREETITYTKPSSICTKTELEEKEVKVHVATTAADTLEPEWWSRFSSLGRLVRVVAYCRRFLNFKDRSLSKAKPRPYLTATELQSSLMCCVRQCQLEFLDEIKCLKDNQVPKKSSLITLCPFLDGDGILRVGGRVNNSDLPENSRNPIIIPGNSKLAKLIVADAHERTLHGGSQLMINFIRTQFWILKIKHLVKSYARSCVRCVRHSSAVATQLMGQLPACRVTANKPFLNSGVDYAGPIQMRFAKGRGQRSYKGYICLFVCMATRAVHIEAVSDLTSRGFLAAFKRFVARRGRCSHLWSDNGTNFVGASKDLKALFAAEHSSMAIEVAASLANNGTTWHFIPPHAPHFGGLWEAGIKSAKYHLKRVIGESTLTYEEMATVLSQIEACLNSRPITPPSADPKEASSLTPGHFLVGEALVNAPDVTENFDKISSLNRWHMTQRMVQSFWNRWSQEYLTQFFQRYKWNTKTTEPRVGDIVLVREINLPPAKWLYGRVEEALTELQKLARKCPKKLVNLKVEHKHTVKLTNHPEKVVGCSLCTVLEMIRTREK
ncbi:uncharacterized protein LOC126375069 [Pectinophora gossypiella]|uniref:uncharacterized protein LOC126375069 n=1 Tax=Pectinophora gossypiella TaxID=13191 RepID=UPI00214F36EE|nr:uncharacterized protein LOC126375069 [Pectinophora gossypiella]